MAKQLVNPIERHVEKAVLGVTGLILVAVIVMYLVRTPNHTELGGESVTPSSIDAKIAAKADEAVKRLKSAQAKATIPEPLFEQFAGSLQPISKTPLPLGVALGPDVPLVDAAGGGGPAALVKVQAPAKPVVAHGRGTMITADAGQTHYVPADWVAVSAVFNVNAQRDAQVREYGALYTEVILGPAQIQRRMQHPDGSWSDDDWKDVEGVPAAKKLPKEPLVSLVNEGDKVFVEKEVLKKIEDFKGDLQNPATQLEVHRPLPPDMAPPTHWTLPLITTYREVQDQDDEFLHPSDAPSTDPADRYGQSGDTGKKRPEPTRELTPAEQTAKIFEEVNQLIKSARQNKSKDDAVRAFNKAQDVFVERNASADDKRKAKDLMEAATQAESDIKRELLVGGNTPPPGGGQVAAAPTTTAKKREKRPTQQAWVHDAAIGSLQNGATYQYRLRFRLLNVLAGAPNKFSSPEDAGVVFIRGEWSEPSDPVTIDPAMHFFVTGEDAKNQEISLEFYQWYLGVWLKPERRIKATIGQTLRDRQRVAAPAIDNPNAVDHPEIEFSADATVLDIDFARPNRERKPGATAKGVRFAPPAPSTSVVLVDSQGRLSERSVPFDKGHPGKREVNGWVWNPPKQK